MSALDFNSGVYTRERGWRPQAWKSTHQLPVTDGSGRRGYISIPLKRAEEVSKAAASNTIGNVTINEILNPLHGGQLPEQVHKCKFNRTALLCVKYTDTSASQIHHKNNKRQITVSPDPQSPLTSLATKKSAATPWTGGDNEGGG